MRVMIKMLFPANPRLPSANILQRYQITLHESSYFEQRQVLVDTDEMRVSMKVRIVI